jgi:ribosomal protein S27AE
MLIIQKEARKTHKGRFRARNKVANEIRSGRLVKQPCSKCGEIKVEAHHKDYRKKLDVQWLCIRHHKEEHLKKA